MDKYEKLLEEIIQNTQAGNMVWEISSANYYETIVFQSGFAATAYSSQYIKKGQNFEVVFVEKHMPSLGGDWDGLAQNYYPELYFLINNGVAFILDQRYVEIERLAHLGDLIKEHNLDAKVLFE